MAAALWAGGAARNARGRWTAIVGVAALLATAAVVLGDRGSPCGGDPSHGRVGIWRAALHTAGERPLQGFGAGTFLAATRERQLRERPVPTRFAHDLALQEWVELGIGGLLAVVAWYLAVGWTLARELWPRRVNGAAWLLAPAVAAFPLANLLDWPWALTGTGVLWAVAVGGLLAGRRACASAERRSYPLLRGKPTFGAPGAPAAAAASAAGALRWRARAAAAAATARTRRRRRIARPGRWPPTTTSR